MTVHAYIADLNRERPSLPNRADAVAMVGVCGVQYGRGCDDLRCFGLRRLSETWERAGHHVDCPACRSEVRRLLAGRAGNVAHEERMRVLEEWIRQHPLRGSDDTLKAEAQRRRCETQRRKARARRAAGPLCECGRAKVAGKAICGAEACALRRAIEVRKRARRTA